MATYVVALRREAQSDTKTAEQWVRQGLCRKLWVGREGGPNSVKRLCSE
jgi:hypothetical protein